MPGDVGSSCKSNCGRTAIARAACRAVIESLEHRVLLAIAPVGAEMRVNEATFGTQAGPAIAMDADGDSVVTWFGYAEEGGSPAIFARLYDVDGNAKGEEFRVSAPELTDAQERPVVAMDDDGDFVIAWHNELNGPIYARRYAADGTPLGDGFLVTGTTISVRDAAIATTPEDGFIVTWAEHGSSGRILARRYADSGAALGNPFVVSTSPGWVVTRPSIGVDPAGQFVIAWESWSLQKIMAQRFTAAGDRLGGEIPVNDFSRSRYNPDVAVDESGNFVVAWNVYEQDGHGAGVYAQRFSAEGVRLGSEFGVNETTAGNQWYPTMAIQDDTLIVAWSSDGQDGSGYGVFARTYDLAGNPTRGEFRINTFASGNQYRNAIAVNHAGHIGFVWQSDGQDGSVSGVYAQRYAPVPERASVGDRVWKDTDADGIQDPGEPGVAGIIVHLFSSEGAIAGTTLTGSDGEYRFDHLRPGEAYHVQVVPTDQWTLAPTDQGGDERLDSDADATGLTGAVTIEAGGLDSSVDIGLLPAATIAGVLYHDTDEDGVPEPSDSPLAGWTVFIDEDEDGELDSGERRTTTGENGGGFAFPGLSAGTYRISIEPRFEWEIVQPEGKYALVTVGRGETASGTDFAVRPTARPVIVVPSTRDTPVNTTAGGQRYNGSVAMDAAGNSMAVWHDRSAAGGRSRVLARVFDWAGAPVTEEISVDPTDASPQYGAQVVAARGGGFVVVWSATNDEGEIASIHARRFDASGNPLGDAFPVAAPIDGRAREPFVAMDDAGNFMIAWQWVSDVGWSSEVFARRYDAAGDALGPEFRVNMVTEDQQRVLSVAMDADGNAIVLWSSSAPGIGGLRAQRYDALGAPIGSEFGIVPAIPDSIYDASISMSRNGQILATWVSETNSGIFEVFLQRFDADIKPMEPAFHMTTVYSGDYDSIYMAGRTAINDAGEFAIVWSSAMLYGADPDVFIRYYNASGLQQGPDLRLSEQSEFRQYAPALAMNSDGRIAVTWQVSEGWYGANIVSRRFAATGAQAPVAEGNHDQSLLLNESAMAADVNEMFHDADHGDSSLRFEVISISNETLVESASIDEAGLLTIRFRLGVTGTAEVDVRATDPGGLFGETTITVTRTNSIELTGDETFTLSGAQSLGAITLSGSSRLGVDPGSSGIISAQSLSIADSATFDLGASDLLLSTTSAERDELIATVSALIASARNGSEERWSGHGLTSSAAAANPLMTIVADAFANYVLVKYTYNGDANLDGQINADDYFRIDQGFLTQPQDPLFSQGDFNYDGRINADDYFLIDSAFLAQSGTLGAPASAASAAASVVRTPSLRRAANADPGDDAAAWQRKRRRTVRAPSVF